MTLFKLKSSRSLLIEDNYNINVLPLVTELVYSKNCLIKIFCYEHPAQVWHNVFKDKSIKCYEGFKEEYLTTEQNKKLICVIDSVNQMSMEMGLDKCLDNLRHLSNHSNVMKYILVLHKDCLISTSKLGIYLNYLTNAVVSYDDTISNKVWIQIKKNGKYFKSEEMLFYEREKSFLNMKTVEVSDKVEEPEKTSPHSPLFLSTFKIETEQIQQLEKNKLQLPYMSKINEGRGKVIYEPDAVDDWDDEDPDDDLDI